VGQENTPVIKNNTELSYKCNLNGQTRFLNLGIKIISDTLEINWSLRKKNGVYLILPKALEDANKLSFKQGRLFGTEVLKPAETFFMISRKAYSGLLENKKFEYNNTIYFLDDTSNENVIKVEGKEFDTWHVIAQVDETEFWILKDPDYPFIIRIEKNPLGINGILNRISYN